MGEHGFKVMTESVDNSSPLKVTGCLFLWSLKLSECRHLASNGTECTDVAGARHGRNRERARKTEKKKEMAPSCSLSQTNPSDSPSSPPGNKWKWGRQQGDLLSDPHLLHHGNTKQYKKRFSDSWNIYKLMNMKRDCSCPQDLNTTNVPPTLAVSSLWAHCFPVKQNYGNRK